jgi:thiamine biosynthesis protein ThiS
MLQDEHSDPVRADRAERYPPRETDWPAMKITLKLYASLTKYLPAGAGRHEIELDLPAGTTPAAVIKQLGLPLELTQLVLVNGVFVAREQRDNQALKEHDQLAIFPPVAGG